MNKVFKVIWNEARNAYVVVSEIAKNRGSKSCSTKKLLAMLIATGVMTCASFDVLAAEPAAAETAKSQYVAFYDETAGLTNGDPQIIDGHKYIYDAANKYWVREGYILQVEENGKLHTPLSANGKAADVAYTGDGDQGSILQSVASTVSANGTVTNMGESLNKITPSAFAGVSHAGGTKVAGSWSYIIHDSSWKGAVEPKNYRDGYADLIDEVKNMPKGFKIAEDPATELNWDATKQAYTYKGKPVDYSNVYVIDGKIGVFTNEDGSEVYKGTVFGKNNEILMTVKDANNNFYSYWASEVTNPSATMQSYRMTKYKEDLAALEENDNMLHRDDIKEVTMTTDASINSATIGLVRNGNTEAGAPVTGAITVTSDGGTGGQDTFVKISNDTANQTFATGSKVEAIVTNDATTGIKINGQEYTIKDNDTQYTAGENVVIDKNNNNKISVDLSQYAKTVDVAVVYNDKNSLHSTNSGNVGEKAIAFGQNAIADGKFSVAIGDSANVDANSVYTSSGAYSTAVGAASGAWGTQATAIGYNAQAKKQNAVALGFSASASATDSVAIGASSIANREAGSLGLYADGRTDSTWKATSGAVSIGQSGTTRQIINLAAGTADTDAVNVAQLNKVKAEADKHTTLVAGANVTLNKEETENGLKYTISATGTNYTAGNGIAIDATNNTISVKLQDGSNLEVSEQGLALKKQLTGMESIQGAGEGKISFEGANVKVNNTTFSENSVVVGGGTDGKTPVTINGTDGVVSGLHNTDIGYTDFATKGNAATEEQLKKVMDAGWKFTTDSGTQTTVTVGEAGNEVKFNGDAANIEVTNTDKDIKVALKKDLTVDSVKAGDFFMDKNNGVGYKGKAYITSSGLNANNQKITGVAAGTISADSTDAVNGSQLYDVKNSINTDISNKIFGLEDDKGNKATNTLGNTVQVKGADGITSTVKDGALEIGLKLQNNSNLVVDSNGLALNTALTGIESINGTGAGSINFADGVIKLNNKVTIDNTGKITGVAEGTETNDAVNFGQLKETNNKVDNLTTEVGKGWTVETENGTATKVGAGDTVKFSGADDNIKVSNTGKDVKVELNKNLTVDSVKAGDFFMDKNNGVGYKGKAYITSSGLNANNQKITGVAAGTIAAGSTDAVNGSQLNDVKNSISNDISNKTFGLEDDKGNKATSTLGNTVQVKGADGITSTVKDGALEIGLKLQDNSNLVVNSNGLALNTALIGIQSITGAGAGSISFNGGNVKVNQNTFNSDGRIQNVANGTETNDAVNFGQLKETNNKVDNLTTEVGKGWKVATENGTETKVGAGDTVKFSGADDNIKVSNTGKDVKVELNKALTGIESINGTGAGSISFADGVIKLNNKVTIDNTGKITGVADGVNNNDAVNVSQLNAVKETANKGWNLSTGKGEVVNVAPDATVDFSGDDNIKVSNNGKDVKVELKKALTGIESINGTGAGSISFADGVIKLNNKVNIDNTGKITGVAAGTIAAGSTDAVNGSQLYDVKVEAGKHSKVVGGNNINVEETDDNGQKIYKVNLNKNIILGDLTGKYVNISGTNGTIETTGSITTNDRVYADKGGKLANIDVTGDKLSNGASSIVMDGSNVKVNDKVTIDNTGKITGVADGVNNNDAVNVGQLNAAVQAGNTDTHIRPGEYGVGADNKVNMDVVDKNGTKINTVTITDVAKASDVGNVNNINNDLKNSNGTTTVVDAVNKLNQKLDNKVGDLNYVAGGAGTKGNYVTNGENTTVSIGKLDQALKDVAATAAKHTTVTQGDNITVTPGTNTDGSKNYNVALNKDITVESVTAGKANIGGVSIENNTVNNLSNKTWDAKNTDQYKDSGKAATEAQLQQAMSGTVQYDRKEDGSVNKTQITLNKEGDTYTTITNVANGKVEKDSKDAINGGQLFDTETKINNRIDGVENQVISNSNRIGQLSSRVNKVGAGAAALAALHPMDFDPDDKLTFSAGYGNYAGQNAAAIGAYYRPDEKVMFSVGGTVGNGENMVNAGISFALDRTNHVSNSRTAMAREILDLRAEVNELRAMVAKGNLGSIEEDKMKIFPDVAENHWAYEYIGKMAAAGMIEGYPDGNFGGDRMMTRYEFAAMLYRAMQKGAQLDSKIVNEFAPEMGRIRVDRISGEDGDRNKIERVRVNATKGERDHYGNKLK